MAHMIRTDDFSIEEIEAILLDAKKFSKGGFERILKDKIIITLFFENSTRTKSSFEIAAKRLGAEIIHLDVSQSSTKKGETLVDTAMNLDAMGPHAIIVRHQNSGVPQILSKYTSEDIHGMIHCSGGAQTKILHFIDNLHVVKDNMFSIPPLFKLIQEQSKTDWKEMYQVFNCGHRMELYVNPEVAEDIIKISKSFNVEAQIVGRVEASSTKKLTIESEYGTFTY